uniref:Trans-acting factor B n=2 Tax=cellular organisms TaxID=131567 RepID=REP1_LACFM|nr:RecName: Full=Trans-acting factor B; AltName: Full=REP1 [Lachancea fermentati]AAA35277.1 trans-acting factor B [Lachancea fermentati]
MGALYNEDYDATDMTETRLLAIPLQAYVYRTFSNVMRSASEHLDDKYAQEAHEESETIRAHWEALETRYEVPDWSKEDFDVSEGITNVDTAVRLAESAERFVRQTNLELSANQLLRLLHYRSMQERQWELETRSYLNDLINLVEDPADQKRIDDVLMPWFANKPFMVELTTEELTQLRKKIEDAIKNTNVQKSARQALKKYPLLSTFSSNGSRRGRSNKHRVVH